MVAGDGDQAPVRHQRRERLLEQLQLAAQAAVGEVAGRDDVVDIRLDQRRAQARRIGVVLLAAADVQIGDVGESPGVVACA